MSRETTAKLTALASCAGCAAKLNQQSLKLVLCEVPVRQDRNLLLADSIPGGSRHNLAYANTFTEWDGTSKAQKTLVTDAQTSGGLLLCVPRKHSEAVLARWKRLRPFCIAVLGEIVRSAKPHIRVRA